MGISRSVRDEVVYVLSGRWPLQLYIAKTMWRYGSQLQTSHRLAGVVARWVWQLEAS